MITSASISGILNRRFVNEDVGKLINAGLVDKDLVNLLLNFLATKTKFQDLLIFNNIKGNNTSLLNRGKICFVSVSFKPPINDETIIDVFNEFKDNYLKIFEKDLIGFEFSFKAVEDGKLRLLDIPPEIKTDLFTSPKLMGFRIVEGGSEISPESINYKEIIVEPLIEQPKILLSLTYRNKVIDENTIRSLIIGSMELAKKVIS
ncbi:hypothetical protein [Stygiolobus caldivivus]|uniref:Uncharacterized protein n=1 Tax=Stygiolobus caldivivus TaxID=2824673 RepID=A0A8D5U4P6_9CREN|nr:hypothetical protein [Stygiolobus caldivivus]BCU69035.1 hypothetical protein KN1_03320 [Stygiolobus caldivivus]